MLFNFCFWHRGFFYKNFCVITDKLGKKEINMDFKDNPEDFDIKRAIDTLKRSYIKRALEKENNLTSAAKLLNLKNYQTLQNWMKELGISHDRR